MERDTASSVSMARRCAAAGTPWSGTAASRHDGEASAARGSKWIRAARSAVEAASKLDTMCATSCEPRSRNWLADQDATSSSCCCCWLSSFVDAPKLCRTVWAHAPQQTGAAASARASFQTEAAGDSPGIGGTLMGLPVPPIKRWSWSLAVPKKRPHAVQLPSPPSRGCQHRGWSLNRTVPSSIAVVANRPLPFPGVALACTGAPSSRARWCRCTCAVVGQAIFDLRGISVSAVAGTTSPVYRVCRSVDLLHTKDRAARRYAQQHAHTRLYTRMASRSAPSRTAQPPIVPKCVNLECGEACSTCVVR